MSDEYESIEVIEESEDQIDEATARIAKEIDEGIAKLANAAIDKMHGQGYAKERLHVRYLKIDEDITYVAVDDIMVYRIAVCYSDAMDQVGIIGSWLPAGLGQLEVN